MARFSPGILLNTSTSIATYFARALSLHPVICTTQDTQIQARAAIPIVEWLELYICSEYVLGLCLNVNLDEIWRQHLNKYCSKLSVGAWTFAPKAYSLQRYGLQSVNNNGLEWLLNKSAGTHVTMLLHKDAYSYLALKVTCHGHYHWS